jgi:hypothetical protein
MLNWIRTAMNITQEDESSSSLGAEDSIVVRLQLEF